MTASEHGEFDVSGAVVNPVFRSTPWEEEARQDAGGGRDGGCVRLLFVSESGVCRGPLSEACGRKAHGYYMLTQADAL